MDPRKLFTQVIPVFGDLVPVADESSPATGGADETRGMDTPANDGRDGTPNRPPDTRTTREAILALLEENGGRMRQRDIVSATSVSKATVSRRLQDLERDGELSRFRLGKGKVVYQPGAGPETAFETTESATAEE